MVLECSSPCQYCCFEGFCAGSNVCNNKKTIIYIIIALVISLVIGCGVFCYCRYQKRQRQREEYQKKRSQELSNRRISDSPHQYYEDPNQSGLENSFAQIGLQQQPIYQPNQTPQYPSNYAFNQARIDQGIPIQHQQRGYGNMGHGNRGYNPGYDSSYDRGYYWSRNHLLNESNL